MRKYSIGILIWLVCITAPLRAQVLASDSLALVALYNQTNGSLWTNNANWLTGLVGTWYGVTRTGNRVTSVNLNDNNLEGTLPSVIGNLTGLTQLILRNNKLSGQIPVEIGNLVNLKFSLSLDANQFSGTIPSSIGNLNKLENLQLHSNQLTGSIPATLGNAIALKNLNLENNSLTGSISSAIGNLVLLEFLYLNNNSITGSIPSELGSLAKLKELDLSQNQLTGSIPASVVNLILLKKMKLNRNQITGSIPLEVTSLTSLTYLNLQDNGLTGVIPEQIGNLSSLTELYLGNDGNGVTRNKLTGTIPVSIGNLSSLEKFKVSGDSLHGTVPHEFSNLTNLLTVDLSDNELDSLPDIGALATDTFDIRQNYFTLKDIYNNLDIGGLMYDPQNSDQLIPSVPDSSQSGLPYTISIPHTDGNVYSWVYNDEVITFPSVQYKSEIDLVNEKHKFTINDLNRTTMGLYSCEITNGAISLKFSFEQQIDATASIAGTLLDETGLPATAGTVELYQITQAGAYVKIPQDPPLNAGQYVFTDVVLANYLVKGTAMSSNPNVIPTWYKKSIYWEEADTVFLFDDVTGIDIESQVKPEPPTTGQGIITGTVYEIVSDEGGKVKATVRVARVPGSVRRVQQSGRTAEEVLVLVDYKFTDENGEFEFTQLDEAEYRLNIQYPGYPMDESSFINIPIGSSLFDRHVFIEAIVINGKISVQKLLITGWEDEQHTVQAYPNPALEYLYITTARNEEVSFTLINPDGKESPFYPHREDVTGRWVVNVQHLKPGTYILRMNRHGKIENLRILIQ